MQTRKSPPCKPKPAQGTRRQRGFQEHADSAPIRSAMESDRAHRAKLWSEGHLSGKDWLDDPQAIPRAQESEQISIRLPKRLLTVLRALAKRRSIGYQILLKDWLDDRAREEARRELGRAKGTAGDTRLIILKTVASLGAQPEKLKDSSDRKRHLLIATAG